MSCHDPQWSVPTECSEYPRKGNVAVLRAFPLFFGYRTIESSMIALRSTNSNN